jgi:tetratricopeptide (TPR) repeat protein
MQALEESSHLAERNSDLQLQRLAQLPLAEIHVREGRAAAACACLAPLLDRPGLEERDAVLLLPTAAWAYLELGDAAHAEVLVAQAVRRARAWRFRPTLVEALRVQALLLSRREQWMAAAHALDEALALARRLPYPYGEARVLQVYGQLHAGRGEQEAAREQLEAALAIVRRLGARKDVERTERAIANLQRA